MTTMPSTSYSRQVTAVLSLGGDHAAVRNRMISDLYRRMGVDLFELLGGTDVTWFSYGALASRTAGDLIADRAGATPPRWGVHAALAVVGQRALQRTPVAGRLLRQALADANAEIFGDVAPPFALLIERLRAHAELDRAARAPALDDAVDDVRRRLGELRPPVANELVDALHAVVDAFAEADPDRRTQLVHLSTLLLAQVEQRSIDDHVDRLLGGREEHVVDPTSRHYRATIGPFRRLRQRVARWLNVVGTEAIVLDLPRGRISPSQGFGALGPPVPALTDPTLPELRAYRRGPVFATDVRRLSWARLDHRMEWFARLVAWTQHDAELVGHGADLVADARLPRFVAPGPGWRPGPGPGRLLAIDHAPGARVAVPLAVLGALEREVGGPLAGRVDGIAGSGTGALLATGLAAGALVDEVAAAWSMARLDDLRPGDDGRRLRIGRFLAALGCPGDPAELSLGDPWVRTLLVLVVHNRDTSSPWLLTNSAGARYNDPLSAGNNLQLPLRDLLCAGLVDPRHEPPGVFTVVEGDRVRVRRAYGPDWTPHSNPALALLTVSRLEPWGVGWRPAPGRPTELVSVGAGRTVIPPGPLRPDGSAAPSPDTGWLSLTRSVAAQQDLVLRLLAERSAGPPIDRELADASSLVLADAGLRYARFDLEPDVRCLEATPSLSTRFVPHDFADDDPDAAAIRALGEVIAEQVTPDLVWSRG